LRQIQVLHLEKPLQNAQVIRFATFEVDLRSGELRKAGLKLKLAGQPFQVLVILLERPGEVVTREELQKRLWPDTFVDVDHNLNTAINKIREVLGDSAENPRFVETIPRRGYRFVGAMQQFPSSGPAGLADVGSSTIGSVTPKALRAWRSRAGLGIAAIALMVLLASTSWLSRKAGRGGETIDSVAVLPFVNASADPNAEYLSDGITESLINSLSQLPNLKVKSRDSVFRYKGKETEPQTIGRQLGVRAVFEGRITQHGDALAISAELIDTQNDNHIWGQQYNRKIRDIFMLQEEIAKEMTAALRLRLTGEDAKRLARSYTANTEAYQDYLRGRYFWNKRSENGLNKSVEYFQKAIAKDPKYALAYSGLSDCYILLPVYGFSSPKEALPKAKEAALKSLEIDDTLAEARTSLASIKAAYDWDWPGAERDFQRAIDLSPRYATARQWYGDALATMGRQEEVIANYKQALELEPLSLVINMSLGQAYYHAREYDRAIEQLQKTLELDPNFATAREYLGLAFLQKSRYKESISEFKKSLLISPDSPDAIWKLGYAYGVTGRKAEALQVLDRLNQLSKRRYVPAEAIACIYVGLGERGMAFEWLEKGYEARSIGLGGIDLKVNPVFDSLRSDPRFADILRRINLQP
jgi:TolB-like protein/DNA-binding winged helix-turn-helix (wHTH) protein/Flp pilus assembly protein TadD